MNGVIAVRALLVAHAPLTTIVPSPRIVAGVIPEGSVMPTISLMSVSSVDRNILQPGIHRHVSERVQVTVMATTYPAAKALMKAVRAAAADQSPSIAGLTAVTVHTDSAGPDFTDSVTSLHLQTQDFRVSYLEAR
ncbi:MAG: DUF3168 domain-containing protein [Sphingomonas sp.]|uniref:tail completion protein gp17 n=1 Tax=Sphingomonas sp. TaxID=28214 RepID=UPI0035A89BF8|nr:DUF3168 domain-containing protein [Sphingomonas sp.]